MRSYQIPYGKKLLTFQVPEAAETREIRARAGRPVENAVAAIRRAVENPIGTPPLSTLVHAGEKVVIVVSDITRLWVRSDILVPVLVAMLNEAGIPDDDISIVFATGDHRRQTPEEHALILGADLTKRVALFDHDCFASDLVDLGVSSLGTPILVNRRVFQADRVIVTGGIAYHLLAGFGGGRKSIAPGVCGYKTIQGNHSLALKDAEASGVNPAVGTGKLSGNPVHEDMLEISRKVGVDFIVNVVVNEKSEYLRVLAGELNEAHLAGCRVVEDIFGIEIDNKADLVIASCGGYPKDISHYQSIKALDNAAHAVKDGGVIILAAECADGVGSEPFRKFFRHTEVSEMQAALQTNFTMPEFIALRAASICRRSPVILISSLEEDTVRGLRMIPAHNEAEAVKLAGELLGREPESVYIMPHAGNTFPILRC